MCVCVFACILLAFLCERIFALFKVSYSRLRKRGDNISQISLLKKVFYTANILVVDDIYDTGYTMDRVIKFLSHPSINKIQGFCLFGKDNDLNISCANIHDGSWIVFPWEEWK